MLVACGAAYGTIPAVARVPPSSPPPPAATPTPVAKPTTKPTTKPHAAPHVKPHAKPHTKPHAKPTTPVRSGQLRPAQHSNAAEGSAQALLYLLNMAHLAKRRWKTRLLRCMIIRDPGRHCAASISERDSCADFLLHLPAQPKTCTTKLVKTCNPCVTSTKYKICCYTHHVTVRC